MLLAFLPLQEFVVQHSENANPPTFFLTMETLLQRMQKEGKMVGLSVNHLHSSCDSSLCWIMTLRMIHGSYCCCNRLFYIEIFWGHYVVYSVYNMGTMAAKYVF